MNDLEGPVFHRPREPDLLTWLCTWTPTTASSDDVELTSIDDHGDSGFRSVSHRFNVRLCPIQLMDSLTWPLAQTPLRLSSWNVLVLIYLCGLLVVPVQSGTSPEGSPCSTANNRIDRLSHRFIDDCDDKTFCSASINGTCIPKRCRTDVFPFGYKEGDALPPLCDSGSFCPDEGGGCRPLVVVGQPCQLNQDRQCAPPPDWKELGSDWNFNGSLCLGSACSCVSSYQILFATTSVLLNGFLCCCVEDTRASRSDNRVR